MKTIIAGSRDIQNYNLVKSAVKESGFRITEVISGGARGVDALGEKYARDNNIPLKQFIPNWSVFGKAAGFMRNEEMGNYADALVALWFKASHGTGHMIWYALSKGLKVYIKAI